MEHPRGYGLAPLMAFARRDPARPAGHWAPTIAGGWDSPLAEAR